MKPNWICIQLQSLLRVEFTQKVDRALDTVSEETTVLKQIHEKMKTFFERQNII